MEEKTDQEHVLEQLRRRRRWIWLGHKTRSDDSIARQVLQWMPRKDHRGSTGPAEHFLPNNLPPNIAANDLRW